MTEQVKRGRGRPKKIQQEVVKQEDVITKEDIEKAINEMLDTKLAEYGVSKIDEQPVSGIDSTDMVAMMNMFLFEDRSTSSPTLEWQPIFNVLTRVYESSDDEYKNVKYNSKNDNIVVTLNTSIYKSLENEMTRVKNAICSSSLKYEGSVVGDKLVILISKK